MNRQNSCQNWSRCKKILGLQKFLPKFESELVVLIFNYLFPNNCPLNPKFKSQPLRLVSCLHLFNSMSTSKSCPVLPLTEIHQTQYLIVLVLLIAGGSHPNIPIFYVKVRQKGKQLPSYLPSLSCSICFSNGRARQLQTQFLIVLVLFIWRQPPESPSFLCDSFMFSERDWQVRA